MHSHFEGNLFIGYVAKILYEGFFFVLFFDANILRNVRYWSFFFVAKFREKVDGSFDDLLAKLFRFNDTTTHNDMRQHLPRRCAGDIALPLSPSVV